MVKVVHWQACQVDGGSNCLCLINSNQCIGDLFYEMLLDIEASLKERVFNLKDRKSEFSRGMQCKRVE